MQWVKSVAKAIAAGATAFGGTFATAYVDNVITSGEWVTIGVATLVAVGAVWSVRNGQAPS